MQDKEMIMELLEELMSSMDEDQMDRLNPKTADDSNGQDMSMDAITNKMDDAMKPNAHDGETVIADGDMDDAMEGGENDQVEMKTGEEMPEEGQYRGSRLLSRLKQMNK